MTDDAVRERHGLSCIETNDHSRTSITIWEGEEFIQIDGDLRARSLTEWQARYLAAKLYRLSRRIRQRKAGTEA